MSNCDGPRIVVVPIPQPDLNQFDLAELGSGGQLTRRIALARSCKWLEATQRGQRERVRPDWEAQELKVGFFFGLVHHVKGQAAGLPR